MLHHRPEAQQVLRAARLGLSLVSLAFIADRISRLGLDTVIDALPTSWLFYVVLIIGYFVPPIFDWRIYRRFWPLAPRDFGLILRKRAFNEAVLDYAGEIEFYAYMRHRPNAAALIKDVNLISGAVSNAATVLLLLGLAVAGHLSLLDQIQSGLARTAVTTCGITGIVLAGFSLAHRRLLSADQGNLPFILSQHALRQMAVLAVLIVQWSAALPSAAIGTWVVFVTAWMVVTRIPLLPSRELLLAALGVALSGIVAAPQAQVAAMFVTGAALTLVLHACALLGSGFIVTETSQNRETELTKVPAERF